MQITNNPNLVFSDISSEEYRIYEFTDFSIKIENPVALNVNSKSGGHRLVDAQGISHYIPSGWKHLSWKAKEGQPRFVI